MTERLSEQLLLYHDLITCIVTALEARDSYTSGHSLRVAEMTERICGYLNMDLETTEIFHIAAHLHDIGKIGVPDAALLKTKALNEQEWQAMKAHPEIGYRILRDIDRFKDIALIVRAHHERWDGHGYPDQLEGTQIPLGARIIAIADSVDAMMSDRPYRKALSAEICRGEIEKHSGIMYDPAITYVVLQNWDDLIDGRVNYKREYAAGDRKNG